MGFQNYCLRLDIIKHKYYYQDCHKISDPLNISGHIDLARCLRTIHQDILLNIFLYCLLHTNHQDTSKHSFVLCYQRMFIGNSCKRIFPWNCQHNNLGYLDILEHKFWLNYQPKSSALWDINWHISKLNCQHMYLGLMGIYLKRMFLFYYPPNCW